MSGREPSTITRALDEHLAAALRSRCNGPDDALVAAGSPSTEAPTVPAMPTCAAAAEQKTRLGWTRRSGAGAVPRLQTATVELGTNAATRARSPARGGQGRRRRALRAAGVVGACVALGLCVLWVLTRQRAGDGSAHRQGAPSAAASTVAAGPPPLSEHPSPASDEGTVAPRPDSARASAEAAPSRGGDAAHTEELAHRAAVALAAGDYAAALTSYRALAGVGDDGAVHAEIVRILALRLSERCGPDCESERAR